MGIFPIVLDASPDYLRRPSGTGSLLLTPVAHGTLLCRLHSRFGAIGASQLTVAASFQPDAAYHEALERACGRISRVVTVAALHEIVATLEPSDWLLFIDPRCTPLEPIDPAVLAQTAADAPRAAVHLVALDTSVGGMREWVDIDDRGDVSRIQRFYDDVTWSYTAGVAASLVPVQCLLTARELRFESLRDLRVLLASRGVPARDMPLDGDAFDLTEERELLAMSDRFVQAARGTNGRDPLVAPTATVHGSARLVGPVVVQHGVKIGENATVVGPSVIGAGAVVGAGSVVLQSVVDRGVHLAPGTVVRQQVVVDGAVERNADAVRSIVSIYDPSRLRGFRTEPRPRTTPTRLYPFIKHVVESTLAVATLIVLLPVLVLIAIAIKLESRGPILFADRREAKAGQIFPCLKFRTMIQGADGMQRDLQARNEVDGPQFKLEKDPRLTRIGRWIRPCSLDELPQLLNVALGHMSLVGPRPSPFRENQTCVAWREGRLSVRPGITGLWQVCRHDRADGDFHQWIHYDLLYVEHMSAALDLKIAIATVLTLGGKWCVPLTWMIPRHKLARAA